MKSFKNAWLRTFMGALAALLCVELVAALGAAGFFIPVTSFNAAGGSASGGNTTVTFTMGPSGTPLAGGNFTLTPGVVAAANVARLGLHGAHAYPTPFRPSAGHTRITFTGLTKEAIITVYTLSGEKVKTLAKDDGTTDSLVWFPVVNDQGSALASGVYPFVVKTPGFIPKKGKLMIIK